MHEDKWSAAEVHSALRPSATPAESAASETGEGRQVESAGRFPLVWWDQIKCVEFKLERGGVGRDRTGRDGVGWDEVGWVRWGGAGADLCCSPSCVPPARSPPPRRPRPQHPAPAKGRKGRGDQEVVSG